jgi:Zn-finger nucleic acid-binding protein
VSGPLSTAWRLLERAVELVIRPFRTREGPNKFRLSSMETATTTYNRSVGWSNRPPATIECPRCSSDIRQSRAHEDIDCPRCVANFEYDEFGELALRQLECPVCRSRMVHGQRHPDRFDIPEWATCNRCRYHWEFQHSY